MISHLKLRLAATAVTLLVVLHSSEGRAHTPAVAATPPGAATAGAERLDHISITSVGKGTPVVLIPGLSSPRATWDGIVPELAKHHRVILVQVNGFGGDAPGANLQPGLLAGVVADLHGYLLQHRLKGVPVVGHSLGGLVALLLAKQRPDDVGKAMIVDSLPYVGEIFAPGATVAMLEPRAAAMRDMMAAAYGQPANPAIAERTAAGLALKPESRATVKGWMMAADPRVSGAAMYEDMTTDLRPDLAALATPLTVVMPFGGVLSEAQATTVYRNAYAKAPHATIVPVADSAHFVMLDQPAAFQAAVDTFLQP